MQVYVILVNFYPAYGKHFSSSNASRDELCWLWLIFNQLRASTERYVGGKYSPVAFDKTSM